MAEGRHRGCGHPQLGGPGHKAAQDGEPGGVNQARNRGVGAAACAALPGCLSPAGLLLQPVLVAQCILRHCQVAVQRFGVITAGRGDFCGWFMFVEEGGSRGITAIQQQVTAADFPVFC